MANVKISALSAASALGGTELIPVVQGGTTLKATPAQVATYVGHKQVLGGIIRDRDAATPNIDPTVAYYNNLFGVAMGLSSNGVDLGAAAIIWPIAGNMKNLYANINGANTLDNSVVLTLWKNGSSTSLTVTFGTTVTGVQSDTSHTVSISAGDEIALKVDPSACSSGRAHDPSFSMVFEATA